ncbi:MAG: NADH-ubiquinone oxidoreductase subunit E family protein [Sulfurospirillum sp.]|nr:NADH-ubiquinone oxidoreductase subunit E family protein [Sulfurospirillum sp.]MBL0703027.1 NADH-ubiquinone oxidoreductase subunit E family protein [Sulfurospirillum sp.]
MQRHDLRHLKNDFYGRMLEIVDESMTNEVSIFIFEIGDFKSVQKSADIIKNAKHTLMNSIKFNEVDWTIVVKKGEDT